MNKTELVKIVAAETEMTQKQAAIALESILDSIQDAVAAGESVALVGFGTFFSKKSSTENNITAKGYLVPSFAARSEVFFWTSIGFVSTAQ